MTQADVDLAAVEAALGDAGLSLLGTFHPEPGDGVPPLADGRPTATLAIAGNVGDTMWRMFERDRVDEPNPLDAWSRRVLDPVAERLGGHALFPFGGPPYLPFQRWAQRAGPYAPSPIGPLIHPDYGLWHAFRSALAFATRLPLPPPDDRARPCETCVDKPCLSTCPVAAMQPEGYDVPACVEHISTPAGEDCVALSCRARRACPIGRIYTYSPKQSQFHMAAFLRAVRAD